MVELPLDEFIQMKGAATFYRSLESFVLLQVLREGPAGATSVVRIRPRDPHVRFAELERSFGPGLQLLVEADGAFTCLMKVGSAVPLCRRLGLKFETGYIVPPMEVAEDRARITFVGSSAEVARLLSAFRRMRYRHRVVSLSDYQLPPPISAQRAHRPATPRGERRVPARVLRSPPSDQLQRPGPEAGPLQFHVGEPPPEGREATPLRAPRAEVGPPSARIPGGGLP